VVVKRLQRSAVDFAVNADQMLIRLRGGNNAMDRGPRSI
jgi:hypothetical protein